jgi:hypothetical protein
LRKDASRILLNATVAFVVALALWRGFAVPYTRLLARLSQALIRISESPAVTSIRPQGTLMVVERSDIALDPSAVRLAVESTDITGNFILLVTLFAATRRVMSDRNVFGFAGAILVLVGVHTAAVIAFVQADYATRFGVWSATHYGSVARALWVAAPYFYSVVGVYGAAFALWWLFRGETLSPVETRIHARKLETRA